MNTTASEILAFLRESDVKFLRLSFCDLFGVQKNIAVMSDELEHAFLHGISFDANAIKGFPDVTASDLLLFPDPSTLSMLPWRPGPGRVARFYCDIKTPDGEPFLNDGRYLLKQVTQKYNKLGYICRIGVECEFYLFKTDENGEPTEQTLDRGGYFDLSPLDKGENMRREICLTLEEMGIRPETSHHERGPGQNEVDFKSSDALTSADNFLTFKSVVKAIAARNGLYASFMPKPIADAAGNGLHINLSLLQNSKNIFKTAPVGEGSKVTDSFLAGIMAKTPEMTLFLNPLANSYVRFGAYEAPKYVSWSHQNRSQLVRIPAATGDKVRMELRSPDPSINPYLAFALIMSAGLEGIEKELPLPPAVNCNLYSADASVTDTLTALPTGMDEAIELAEHSVFIKSVLGENVAGKYIALKKQEAQAFAAAQDKQAFYKEQYFFNC